MGSRLELHEELCEALGSRNVYYQPPASVEMSYPAIRYNKDYINSVYANNDGYLSRNRYQLIVIDRMPDNPVIMTLLEKPYCSFDRHYTADNLNHDVLTIYY